MGLGPTFLNVACLLSLGVASRVVMRCSGRVGCCQSVLSVTRVVEGVTSWVAYVLRHVDVGPPASDAHPAATPSAVFCVFCRLVMFISAASGAQTVGVHSNMVRMVVVLYPRP